MDCTYKTNRYKMPLLIISGLNRIAYQFLCGFFASWPVRTKFDYTWVLRQVKALYLQMELPDPTVIGTDMERSLMLALRAQFSSYQSSALHLAYQ